jgi:small subunit ribosomal protein S8
MDPITDMLNRIRNGLAVKKEEVLVPFSKFKLKIAQILEKEGFIEKVEIKKVKKRGEKERKPVLKISLKYEGGEPVISGLKRISRPGQRIYLPARKIKKDLGITIVSTSQGLMTDKEARKKKLGGEIVCQVW